MLQLNLYYDEQTTNHIRQWNFFYILFYEVNYAPKRGRVKC